MTAVESLTEAVSEASIICLCLADDDAVASVVDAALEQSSVSGKLFVDLSTVHPKTNREQSDKLQRAGADYIACPSKSGAPVSVTARLLQL